MLTKDEARRIAANVAKLPLVGSYSHTANSHADQRDGQQHETEKRQGAAEKSLAVFRQQGHAERFPRMSPREIHEDYSKRDHRD